MSTSASRPKTSSAKKPAAKATPKAKTPATTRPKKGPGRKRATHRVSPQERAVFALSQAAFDAHRLVHMAQHDESLRRTLPQPLRVHCLRIARRTLEAAWQSPPMQALEAVLAAEGARLGAGELSLRDADRAFRDAPSPARDAFLVQQHGASAVPPGPTMETLPADVERVHDLLHAALTMLTIDDHELKRDTNHERLGAFLMTREALLLLRRIDALPEMDAALGDMTQALALAGALFAKDPTRVRRRFGQYDR